MAIAVKINTQNQQKVRAQTPIASNKLTALTDVAVIEASNNAVVVYNTTTERFEVKALPIIFGGNF